MPSVRTKTSVQCLRAGVNIQMQSCFFPSPVFSRDQLWTIPLLFLPHVGAPLKEIPLQKAASFSCFFNYTVLLFTAKLWQMEKSEGGTTWYFHPSELMLTVLIWGKQIQICFFSDGLKRYSYIWLLQPARISSRSSLLCFIFSSALHLSLFPLA